MRFNALCNRAPLRGGPGCLTKTMTLAMKFTSILLLAACLEVSAGGTAQTLTYSGKSIALTKLFSVIREQTGYVFFYDKQYLDGATPVTVTWRQTPLREALQDALAGQP